MYHQTHTKNQHSPSSDVELSELLELSGQMRIELMVGLSEYSASLLPTLAMLFFQMSVQSKSWTTILILLNDI